jgi:hypothetical protein
MDSAMRRRFNPFAEADREDAAPRMPEERERETKRRMSQTMLLHFNQFLLCKDDFSSEDKKREHSEAARPQKVHNAFSSRAVSLLDRQFARLGPTTEPSGHML